METTPYFDDSRPKPGHMSREIALVALANEVERRIQSNGLVKVWGWVEELDVYVRVVLSDGGKTLHNAFMDSPYTKRRGRL